METKKQVQEKIGFYEDNSIVSNWLISAERYNEQDGYLKVNFPDNLLIQTTGIDKFYIGDWYEKIIKGRLRRSLPTDFGSLGSLMYLDMNNELLKIVRALTNKASWTTLHDYREVVSGKLHDVTINLTKHWGIVWYFEEEKVLGEQYREAKRVLKVLNDDCERHKYEELIHHYADMGIDIDLDDGVKINYAKFDGLAKI